MKNPHRIAAATAIALVIALAGVFPAYADTAYQADGREGATLCGRYESGPKRYHMEMPITRHRGRTSSQLWSRVQRPLGTVFPLYNFTKQYVQYDNYGNAIFDYSNTNTAMNNLWCGSKFYVGAPKSFGWIIMYGSGGPHAGQMQVIQVRTNGISFKGVSGVMKGSVMNFRIRKENFRTYLNVYVTGPNITGFDSFQRDIMRNMARQQWQQFADNIGNAQ